MIREIRRRISAFCRMGVQPPCRRAEGANVGCGRSCPALGGGEGGAVGELRVIGDLQQRQARAPPRAPSLWTRSHEAHVCLFVCLSLCGECVDVEQAQMLHGLGC